MPQRQHLTPAMLARVADRIARVPPCRFQKRGPVKRGLLPGDFGTFDLRLDVENLQVRGVGKRLEHRVIGSNRFGSLRNSQWCLNRFAPPRRGQFDSNRDWIQRRIGRDGFGAAMAVRRRPRPSTPTTSSRLRSTRRAFPSVFDPFFQRCTSVST